MNIIGDYVNDTSNSTIPEESKALNFLDSFVKALSVMIVSELGDKTFFLAGNCRNALQKLQWILRSGFLNFQPFWPWGTTNWLSFWDPFRLWYVNFIISLISKFFHDHLIISFKILGSYDRCFRPPGLGCHVIDSKALHFLCIRLVKPFDDCLIPVSPSYLSI